MTGVGNMTRVVSSDSSRAYDWSHVFRPESHLPNGVAHMAGVASSVQSQTYNRSRIF
jgi:hypothetical protein